MEDQRNIKIYTVVCLRRTTGAEDREGLYLSFENQFGVRRFSAGPLRIPLQVPAPVRNSTAHRTSLQYSVGLVGLTGVLLLLVFYVLLVFPLDVLAAVLIPSVFFSASALHECSKIQKFTTKFELLPHERVVDSETDSFSSCEVLKTDFFNFLENVYVNLLRV